MNDIKPFPSDYDDVIGCENLKTYEETLCSRCIHDGVIGACIEFRRDNNRAFVTRKFVYESDRESFHKHLGTSQIVEGYKPNGTNYEIKGLYDINKTEGAKTMTIKDPEFASIINSLKACVGTLYNHIDCCSENVTEQRIKELMKDISLNFEQAEKNLEKIEELLGSAEVEN